MASTDILVTIDDVTITERFNRDTCGVCGCAVSPSYLLAIAMHVARTETTAKVPLCCPCAEKAAARSLRKFGRQARWRYVS